MGLRLRWVGDDDHDVSYRDLLTIAHQAPRSSAVMRNLDPDFYQWGLQEHLLASIADAVRTVNWQLGGEENKRPEPLLRPGVAGYESLNQQFEPSEIIEEPAERVTQMEMFENPDASGTFYGVATPIDELNEWLGWTTEREEPAVLSRDELIVADYAAGAGTYRFLGEKYGVSASTIGRIVRAHT